MYVSVVCGVNLSAYWGFGFFADMVGGRFIRRRLEGFCLTWIRQEDRYSLDRWSFICLVSMKYVEIFRNVVVASDLNCRMKSKRIDADRKSNTGGTLRVRHRGQTVDFAWGDDNHQGILQYIPQNVAQIVPRNIQRAAFYGDCELEVLEVTKGHRVTLTYNPYYSSIGRLAKPLSTTHHLPFYNVVRRMLQEPAFLRNGETEWLSTC